MKQGGADWIRGYGVRCNNCFMYFKDDDDIPAIYDSEHEPGHKGLTCCGCPNCMTDEYLMDAEEYQSGVWKEGHGPALDSVDSDGDVTVYRDERCIVINDSNLGDIALLYKDARELARLINELAEQIERE